MNSVHDYLSLKAAIASTPKVWHMLDLGSLSLSFISAFIARLGKTYTRTPICLSALDDLSIAPPSLSQEAFKTSPLDANP